MLTKTTRAILVIAFMMGLARAASPQAAPHASVDRRPIKAPIIDGAADIRFARISTADGLSQTKVDRIVQDDQGFMWFGTQYGLNR